ncbi:MAG: regulatory protein RecX [bacterium]
MDVEHDFQRAKELAINYLSYRPRSSKEVRTHLVRKGYPVPLADRVVDYLRDARYIDDQDFAAKWYVSRVHKGGYGPVLIARELAAKGIPAGLCSALRARFYPQEKEQEEARRLAEKRCPEGSRDPRERKRVYEFLLRRGFSPEAAHEAVGLTAAGE